MKLRDQSASLRATLGVILVALQLVACAKRPTAAPVPRPVRTLIVDELGGARTATYTGEVRSRYETDLSFQVGGKLVSRGVDVGAAVKRGQALARLDPADQNTNADAARAAVRAAAAELERARTEEARYRDLLERGLTTNAAFLTQQTQVKTTQSRLEQASSDLKLSLQRVGYTTLRADQDGVVTQVLVEAGTVVAMGQPILSIARPSELEAVFDVPDAHIDSLRGTPVAQVALLSDPLRQFPARIREISPSADPVTRTYRVKAAIADSPAGLRLGASVAVTLPRTVTTAVLALPATALTQQNDNAAVWVVKTDQTLELRPVRVDRYEADRVLIAAGVNVGERIVTGGVHRLAKGERVRLLEEVAP